MQTKEKGSGKRNGGEEIEKENREFKRMFCFIE